ncbi:MAG: polymerase sigma factor [Paenibacillus sp.]|nr:polymerase sigma factor [Paenibacillus sp.]
MTQRLCFDEAVKPWLEKLRQYCVYLTGSPWDGEDLMQDAIALTYRYYKRKGEIKDIRPFLMKVAKNKRIDELRRRRFREEPVDLLPEEGRRDVCGFEIRGWLEWVAAELTSSQMNVWLLADYFGHTMNEIANALGLSMSAVRSQLFRARETLRARRAAYGQDAPAIAAGFMRRSASSPTYPRSGISQAVEASARSIMNNDPTDLFLYVRTGS